MFLMYIKQKKEACEVRDRINLIGDMGKAYVENQRRGNKNV